MQKPGAQKEILKRAAKHQASPPPREPEHNYDAILTVSVMPQFKTAFWKSWGDSMASNGRAPTTVRPKNAFGRMRLLCGDKEVEPILPGRLSISPGGTSYVQVDQSTYFGKYVYAADAVSPACGRVTLEVFATGDDVKALTRVLDPQQVNRIWQDFEPYRKLAAKTPSQ